MGINLTKEEELEVSRLLKTYQDSDVSMQELDTEAILYEVWELLESFGYSSDEVEEFIRIKGDKWLVKRLLIKATGLHDED